MPETNRKGQVELENLVFELSGFNRNEQGAEEVLQMEVVQITTNIPSFLFLCIFFKFSKSDLSVWRGGGVNLIFFCFSRRCHF